MLEEIIEVLYARKFITREQSCNQGLKKLSYFLGFV